MHHLGAQKFSAILDYLKPRQINTSERRARDPRIGVQTRISSARWHAGRVGEIIELMSRDISAAAMGFWSGAGLMVGEELVLLLPGQRRSWVVLGNVVYATAVAEGVFDVGVGFVEVLAPAMGKQIARELGGEKELQGAGRSGNGREICVHR